MVSRRFQCLALALAISNAEFIEDFYANTVEPTVDVLAGVSGSRKERPLLLAHPKKENYLESMAFDFPNLKAHRNLRAEEVRIYVHDVPTCGGEELLSLFTQPNKGFGWDRAVHLHAMHMKSVHDAILTSANRVDSPEKATVFYIPTFFTLLVERYIDLNMNYDAVNCIAHTWNSLPPEFFHRNAGYDHFISAGTCFPFSLCGSVECDIMAFHPFARNVMRLVGGVRDIGHPDFAFTSGAAFRRLHTIVIPFPVTLDCERALKLADPERKRDIVASFVGSDNSRIRTIFRSLFEMEMSDNIRSKFYIKVFPDLEGADGHAARKETFADDSQREDGSRGIDDLYSNSEFCLVLPGHIYDLSRRGYDAMARACLPVIVSMDPMFVNVPFAGQIPWEDFAIFALVRNEEDAAGVLESLLQACQTEEGRASIRKRRATLMQYIPRLFLPPHANCLPGLPTAFDGILTELAVRQVALSAISIFRPVSGQSPQTIAV